MTPDIQSEVRSLAAGVRAVAAVFTLLLSYFNIRLAFQIGKFEQIFRDMLGGRSLPTLTEFVLHNRTLFLFASFAIPVAAVVVVWRIRSHKLALCSLAGLMGAVFLQAQVTWAGIFGPLMAIVNGLGGQ